MIRLLVDEDFNNDILRGLRRRVPDPMPGVIAVAQSTLAREAIEDLVIILRCSTAEEWRDQVSYLPLR